MKKRLTRCLVVALLLSLALAGTVQAASVFTTTVTATAYLPDIVIDVVVPTAGNVYINPKQLPVKIGASIENEQIISEPCYIRNQSEVPVLVSVEVTGTVKSGSDLSLLSYSTADLTTRLKKAFIYFEILATNDPSSVSWASGYDESQHIVVRESPKTKKNIVTLGTDDSNKCYGAFRLTGDCIAEPREEWNSKDGVTVNIVFTFSPLPIDTEIP